MVFFGHDSSIYFRRAHAALGACPLPAVEQRSASKISLLGGVLACCRAFTADIGSRARNLILVAFDTIGQSFGVDGVIIPQGG